MGSIGFLNCNKSHRKHNLEPMTIIELELTYHDVSDMGIGQHEKYMLNLGNLTNFILVT